MVKFLCFFALLCVAHCAKNTVTDKSVSDTESGIKGAGEKEKSSSFFSGLISSLSNAVPAVFAGRADPSGLENEGPSENLILNASKASEEETDADKKTKAATGNAATGNAPAGNAATGNAPAGNAPAGNAATGNAATGNAPAGNAATGNAPAGNAPTGNAPAGNAPTGNATDKKNQEGQAPNSNDNDDETEKKSCCNKYVWIGVVSVVLLVLIVVSMVALRIRARSLERENGV